MYSKDFKYIESNALVITSMFYSNPEPIIY